MNRWRHLPTRIADSYTQMAIDEAMLASVARGAAPALRFYRWSCPAVAIGYHQVAADEVDLDACREQGVELFRRLTGGGAVYKDPHGELNYSIVLPESYPGLPRDVDGSYRRICSALVRALAHLGVEAQWQPVNDVAVAGRKISGNAQTRERGVLLMHGTLLLDFDAERMASLLIAHADKLERKKATSLRARVVTLRELLSGVPSFERVERALLDGFAEEFAIGFDECDLSEEELAEAQRLRERYASDAWNYKR